MFSTDTRKIAPIATGAHVPVLAFTNDRSAAQPGVYVMGVTPQDEVERVLQYAASQGMQRFAILAPTSPYGNIVTQSFRNSVQSSNGILAEMELYDPNSPDYTQVVEQLSTAYQNNPFDALMLPEGGARLRQLAPLLPAFQIGPQTVRIVGTGLWANDPALAQETGLVGGWYAATDPSKWQPFAERYAGIYGQVPDQRAGLVYDAITLIVALGKAPVPDYSETALTNVSGFNGVTGVFRLNPDGTVERRLAILEVVPGGATVRDPAPGTFAAAINQRMWMALYDVGGKTVLCLVRCPRFAGLGLLDYSLSMAPGGTNLENLSQARHQASDCVARDPSRFSVYRSSRSVQIALDRLSGLDSR